MWENIEIFYSFKRLFDANMSGVYLRSRSVTSTLGRAHLRFPNLWRSNPAKYDRCREICKLWGSLLFCVVYNLYLPLQFFSQDCGLTSRKWQDLQFNVDSERQIFETFFHGRFIYTQSFCQKSAEKSSSKISIAYSLYRSI